MTRLRRTGMVLAGAVAFLTGALGACGGDPGEVVVDIDDTGTVVEVSPDETLVVRLFESPSTGYTWQWVEEPDGSVLGAVSDDFEQDEPVQPGSGGTRVWRFAPVAAGETSLSMVERFQDDDESTSATFELGVVVTDG
jgi:predicted secreted protein